MIDTHQHFWKLSRNDYSWLTPKMEKLYRDYLPKDLKPELDLHYVSGTILVQAAPSYEETNFLLGLYEQYEWIYGVIGWLDFESSTFATELDNLLKKPGLVGLRPMLQDIEDENWILKDVVQQNIQRMISNDLPLDLLINERHFSAISSILEALPDLRVVINHMAKPDIKSEAIDLWGKWMTYFSKNENVYCKISGLMTEAKENWRLNDFVPYIEHVYESFGSSRLLFGSDWPVCLLAGNYLDSIEIARFGLTKYLEKEDDLLEKIFYTNALEFYRLNEKGRLDGEHHYRFSY